MPELSKKKSFADLRGLLINKNSNPKDSINSNHNNNNNNNNNNSNNNSPGSSVRQAAMNSHKQKRKIDPEVKKIADDFKNSPLIDEDVEIPEEELTPGQKK